MLLSWTKWRLIVFFENAGKENLQLSSFVEALQIEALVSMLLFLYMNRGFLGIFRIAYGKSECTFNRCASGVYNRWLCMLQFRASDYPREYDGACLQMRLSYSPAAQFFLFLVQWTDCHLAGALGLLRIFIYKVICTFHTHLHLCLDYFFRPSCV